MELFTQDTGWDQARTTVRFTMTAGRASKVHAGTVSPLRAMLGRWDTLDAERRDADDAVEDAHAEVAWAADSLDEAIGRFALRLQVTCGDDRAHPTFATFFTERPSELTRLGPEQKVERVRRWRTVRLEVKLPEEAAGALDAVASAAAQADAVIEARKVAVEARARVSLRMKAWREEANTARRAVEVALDQHAVTQGLPKGYSARFFPKTPSKKKPKGEQAKKTDAKKTDVLTAKTVPPAAPTRPSAAPPN